MDNPIIKKEEPTIFTYSGVIDFNQLCTRWADSLASEKDEFAQLLADKLRNPDIPNCEKEYIMVSFIMDDFVPGRIEPSDTFIVDMAIHDLADEFLLNNTLPNSEPQSVARYEAENTSRAIRRLIECDYDYKYDFLCRIEDCIHNNLRPLYTREACF